MNTSPVEELLRAEIGLDTSSIGQAVVERSLRRQLAAKPGDDPSSWVLRLRAEPALLRRVIEDVVVPETWFFRDGRPFEVLAEEAMKRRGRGRPLRVLSLPCATGEEAWTIAITLREAGFAPEEFTVSARDVSTVATTAAKRGIYGKNSFRGDIGPWRGRWLTAEPDGEHWRVNEALRASVDFAEANLFAPGAGDGPFDFVFCRNLLIYFDVERQREAMRRLRILLATDGLLFVGHAEAAVALREGFFAWPVARSFAMTAAASTTTSSILPASWSPFQMPPAPSVDAPVAAPATRPFADVIVTSSVAETPAEASSLERAASLADRGELAAAAVLAEAHLRAEGPDPEAYYLLGLVRDAAGDTAGAEASYRKTLYLVPGHGRALAHLALLLEGRGDVAGARRLRERAARGGAA